MYIHFHSLATYKDNPVSEPVSQAQFASTMNNFQQIIRDQNEQSNINLQNISKNLEALAIGNAELHELQLGHHAKAIEKHGTAIETLQTHSTQTKVYWAIFGAVLLVVAGTVLKMALQ